MGVIVLQALNSITAQCVRRQVFVSLSLSWLLWQEKAEPVILCPPHPTSVPCQLADSPEVVGWGRCLWKGGGRSDPYAGAGVELPWFCHLAPWQLCAALAPKSLGTRHWCTYSANQREWVEILNFSSFPSLPPPNTPISRGRWYFTYTKPTCIGGS